MSRITLFDRAYTPLPAADALGTVTILDAYNEAIAIAEARHNSFLATLQTRWERQFKAIVQYNGDEIKLIKSQKLSVALTNDKIALVTTKWKNIYSEAEQQHLQNARLAREDFIATINNIFIEFFGINRISDTPDSLGSVSTIGVNALTQSQSEDSEFFE